MTAQAENGGRPSGRSPLSEAELQEIVRLHGQGLNDVEIAREMGRKDKAVWQNRRRLGLPAHTGRPWTDEETERLLAFARQGLYHREIGQRLGRPRSSVSVKLKELGSGRRGHRLHPQGGSRCHPANESVISAARRSSSLAETARAVSMDTRTVKDILEAHAPELLFFATRPGIAIRNTAHEPILHEQNLREYGFNAHELVEVWGPEEVERWVEIYDAGMKALRRLRNELSDALEAQKIKGSLE